MATINRLIEYLTYTGGLELTDVRTRARYLREAGILPASAKGKTPQVESVHAIALLLACVGHQHQTHAIESLRTLWALPKTETCAPRRDGVGDHAVVQPAPSFGALLHSMVAAAAKSNDGPLPESFEDACEEVTVRRGLPFAYIIYREKTEFFQGKFPPLLGLAAAMPPDETRQIEFNATVPWHILRQLGLLVAESKLQAAKLGVTIETDSAWHALGCSPAGPLPVPPSPSGSPSGNGRPENEYAVTPGRATAPIRDRDNPDAHAEPSDDSERDQQPQSLSSRGRGPSTSRRRP